MAKILYGPAVAEARGKAGDSIFTKGRAGNVLRALRLATVPTGKQPANKVFAGPASGPTATPTFRSLVTADLPALPILDGARVYNSTAIPSPNEATTMLTWDSVHYDNAGLWSALHTYELLVIRPGIYMVALNLAWTQNANGMRHQWIINGATGLKIGYIATPPTSSGWCNVAFSTLYHFDAGGEIVVQVYQDSGVTLNLYRNADDSPELSAQLIQPDP